MSQKLQEMSPKELGTLFPIILSEHSKEWAIRYIEEEKSLRSSIKPEYLSRIDHIGSTAIPGLISKPTIDILIQIQTNTPDREVIDNIKKLGYIFLHKPENPAPHMLFVKGYTKEGFAGQAYHVHVRYPGDWDEIWFRDYLISHPESREKYARLKKNLAKKFPNDRDGYTDAKTDFVNQVCETARSLSLD